MGLSNEYIGQIVDAHRNSVDSWIRAYKEQGVEGITTLHYRVPESELSSYAEVIKSHFATSFIQSTKEFSEKICELTGLKRGLTQVRKFIKSIGFQYRQSGHIPAKADPVRQREWKEKILDVAIEEAQNEKCHLFFCDAAHFVLAPFICKVRSMARMFVKASGGRNRIHVLGAVNAISKEVITLINTTFIDAAVIITFLNQLKEKHMDRPIKIVLDNARYQHCKAVMDTAQRLNIELLFLPPYSPNLNVIERLWKYTKKKILNTVYYETPAKFHEAVTDFINRVSTKYCSELNKLFALNFHFFDDLNAQNMAA
jgi:transposase